MRFETVSTPRSPNAPTPSTKHYSVSTSVVELISDVNATPIEDLPPLTTAVDPDALDELVASGETTIAFVYAGHTIVVTSVGDITVY